MNKLMVIDVVGFGVLLGSGSKGTWGREGRLGRITD